MNYFKNAIGHFKLITNHKILVFKLCVKTGEFWRGLTHDLSKYSPTEFFEGVKYYNGGHSPILDCKKEHGYSKAWLHHKGRNKHHSEYWIDLNAQNQTPIMPYNYVVEMLCDKLAAGIIYKGKSWTKEYPLQYWMKEKDNILINEHIKNLTTEFFIQISENGIEKTLTRENIQSLYEKHCGISNKIKTFSTIKRTENIEKDDEKIKNMNLQKSQ